MELKSSTDALSRFPMSNEFEQQEDEQIFLPSPKPIKLGDFFNALKNHQQNKTTTTTTFQTRDSMESISSSESEEESQKTEQIINPEGKN